MMSTLQKYFNYSFNLMCGIPNVTLEGTIEDYTKLRNKLDKLLEYDINGEIKKWHNLLSIIFDNLLLSVIGNPKKDFWETVCHYSGGGSGPTYLSGWVTTFTVFDTQGNWIGTKGEGNWEKLDTMKISYGYNTVPVIVDDDGVGYKTTMIAGSFGINAYDETTLQPRNDWAILLNN